MIRTYVHLIHLNFILIIKEVNTTECRICGQISNDLESVFSFVESGRLLSDLIYIVCPIRIEVSDDLPKKICEACKEIIVTSVQLREMSVRSDLKFRHKNLQGSEVSPTIDPVYVGGLDGDWDTFEDDTMEELHSSVESRGKNYPISQQSATYF